MVTRRQIYLRFAVGGRDIFSVSFTGSLFPQFFTDTPPAVENIEHDLSFENDAALMPNRPLCDELPKLSVTRDVIRYVPVHNPRYYIDIHKDVPSCFERPSNKKRREICRKLRKFEEACGVQPVFREYLLPDEAQTFHSLAKEIALTTSRDHLTTAFAKSETLLRDLIALAEQKAFRGYILFYGERPVAFEYFRTFDDVLVGEMCGYNPDFAKWSPGVVLLYCVLLKLSHEGTWRLLDFGPGYAPYKESLATGSVLCADIFYFRNKVRYRGIVLVHRGFLALSRAIATVLDRFRLRRPLKQLIVGQSGPSRGMKEKVQA